MLREDDGDAALIDYCERLRGRLAEAQVLGEPVRALLDAKPGKAAAKRWDWVRKGAPLIVEVGARDMAEGKVTLLHRDALWAENGKPAFAALSLEEAARSIPSALQSMQHSMLEAARDRRDRRIARNLTDFAALEAFFADEANSGWVEVQWSKPSGAALDAVAERLKALKLTLRNVPMGSPAADGPCIFTGAKAVERVLVAKAY